MRISRLTAVFSILALTTFLIAEQAAPPAQGQRGRGGRGGRGQQLTPEQREAQAREAHEREAAFPRPIAAKDSVWIEELTYLEVRDAMKAGKTTALIFAGSTEQNGPYLDGAKHYYALKQVGEAIARKLGNALIAPLVLIEAGNPENKYLEWGSIYFTQETYNAVLRDIATSLKSQGFKNIIMMGDSGGNTAGLRTVAAELKAKWAGSAGIYHIPEFYNWTSQQGPYGEQYPRGVRDFVVKNGIDEKSPSLDGFHDEYGLTAVMMAYDPKTVRYDERVAAGKATINGVSIVPKEKTIAFGKRIVEYRTNVAVDAIRKALAGSSN
jgi:creatinine amidohydrolase/Fe(II)-dependent formamide hydrolase-like protein